MNYLSQVAGTLLELLDFILKYFRIFFWALIISVPLAIWKIVDIIIWLCKD